MGTATSFPQDIFPEDIVTVIVEFWAENFAEYLRFGRVCKFFHYILEKMHESRSSFVNYYMLTENYRTKRQGFLQRAEDADSVVFLNGVYSLKHSRFQAWKEMKNVALKPLQLKAHFIALPGGVHCGFPTQFNNAFLSQILEEHNLQIAAKGLRYRQLWNYLEESLIPRLDDLPYTIVLRGQIPDDVYYILTWYFKSTCMVRPIDMHFSYRCWSNVEALFLKLEDFVADDRDESENLCRLVSEGKYASSPKFEHNQNVQFPRTIVIFMERLLREGLRQRRMAMLDKLRKKLGNAMKEIVWNEDPHNYDPGIIFDRKEQVITRMKRDKWFIENRRNYY